MAKTNNNSLKLQRAVRSLFYDYQEKNGCLGTTYAQAACGCDNALQMWRGPKGDKGDQGPQGPKGDNAGSFLVSAEFVVNPAGQPEGSYLKLVLIDVAQQEQVVYVNLSELEDVYSAGNGIDITSMVVAAKLGAGLTFDQQGNITSAYQFCDGLDETSNVVTVKLDANNNILGFAGSGCKGLTATVNLTQAASGVALVLTGASGAVLSTVPLEGGTGITVQKNAQTGGFTWLVDFNGVISSTAGNNLTISDNKLYVGNSTLSYTVGDGVFTLTNAAGGTSTVTLPTVVRSLDRADLVCEGENAPYLRLTFKRDNGQNLYQDVSLACLASALDVISDVSLDVQCETSRDLEPIFLAQYYGAAQAGLITQEEYEQWVQNTSYSPSVMAGDRNHLLDTSSLRLSCDVEYEGDPPVAYAAYVELVSNNDSFWFAPNPDVTEFNNWRVYVPLSTLLAAGDEGYRLVPVATTDPDYTGDGTNANIPDRTIRVVTTVDTSGAVPEYTVTYYWDNGVSDKPTTDLVITNAGGDETRVDLNPALTHVGGNVLTVADTADRELVALHTHQDLPRTESGAPNGYAMSMNLYPNANVCDNSNQLAYLSDNASDGVYTMYVESGTITHFAVSIYDYIPVPGGTQYDYSWNRFETYVEIDHANNNACIDVDNCTSVADLTTTGVVIYGHDTQGKRLEELSLYLTGELVEDGQGHSGLAIHAYRQGAKKVLRLGPSCSPDIPLSSILSDVSLDAQCKEVVIPSHAVPYENPWAHTDLKVDISIDGTNVYSRWVIFDVEEVPSFDLNLSSVNITENSTVSIRIIISPSNNSDFGNWYELATSSFADLLAAGSTGVPMEETFCDDYPGIIDCVEVDGKKMYISCTAAGGGFYTFYPFVVVPPASQTTLVTDLVLNDTRIDMKPLLSYVGGEFRDVVDGSEAIPLIGRDVADSALTAGFVIDYLPAYSSAATFCGSGSDYCDVVSAVTHDGVVDICYDSTPVAFELDIFRINDYGQEAEPGVAYTTYGPDECTDSASPHSLIESYIAAGSEGLPLYRVTNWNFTTGELSDIRLVITPLEGENCYRFSILQPKMVQKLCLGPSCDPCIDLAPAVADCVASVSGTVDCGGDCFPWPTDKTLYCIADFYDANDNHLAQSSCTVYDCTITGLTIPTGAASVSIELSENYDISHRWSFTLPLTEGATAFATAEEIIIS